MKNLIIGIVLAIVAIALLVVFPELFLYPMIELIKGAIVPIIAFFALIFLLIGWDELQAPKIEELEEEEEKEEKEAKPKRKKK